MFRSNRVRRRESLRRVLYDLAYREAIVLLALWLAFVVPVACDDGSMNLLDPNGLHRHEASSPPHTVVAADNGGHSHPIATGLPHRGAVSGGTAHDHHTLTGHPHDRLAAIVVAPMHRPPVGTTNTLSAHSVEPAGLVAASTILSLFSGLVADVAMPATIWLSLALAVAAIARPRGWLHPPPVPPPRATILALAA